MSRGKVSGPFAGAYDHFEFTFPAVANNDTLIQRHVMLAPFRVCRVAIVADTVTSDPTFAISNGAAGGTDLVAAVNMPASDTAAMVEASALTNRNLARGDVLTCTIVADAGDAATHVVVDVGGYYTGHMVSAGDQSDAND